MYGQPFGRGTGPIHMNGFECQGNESSILQCNHRGWGNHHCDHSRDTSVNCTSYRSMVYIYYLYLQRLQARSTSVGWSGACLSLFLATRPFSHLHKENSNTYISIGKFTKSILE